MQTVSPSQARFQKTASTIQNSSISFSFPTKIKSFSFCNKKTSSERTQRSTRTKRSHPGSSTKKSNNIEEDELNKTNELTTFETEKTSSQTQRITSEELNN
ncbi:hypothetical protein PIB30_026138 [Stylosanthes scabra]|uniref:Uncharacterized protein n=1 Tax=Stylosanthes scabra TaxID=79078 RepID=A0ABU6U953_9FABA|nr:hypothetical protein [Stylosanthes scabra]